MSDNVVRLPHMLSGGSEALRIAADEVDTGIVNGVAMVTVCKDMEENVTQIETFVFYDGPNELEMIGAVGILRQRIMATGCEEE